MDLATKHPTMTVYQHPVVRDLLDYYGDLLYRVGDFPEVRVHLSALADRLWAGLQAGHAALYREISNYHPAWLGKAEEQLREAGLSYEDCRDAIAAEYGFGDWPTLAGLKVLTYDPVFEGAVNALLAGDLAGLTERLDRRPELVQQRSSYGHRATLLHYAASNGVELWRQQVPANLPALTRLLLARGADREATMYVYGGAHTARELLATSVHPFRAGVGAETLQLLQ